MYVYMYMHISVRNIIHKIMITYKIKMSNKHKLFRNGRY